jgi:two-component system sensor histidine kinase/response regulator
MLCSRSVYASPFPNPDSLVIVKKNTVAMNLYLSKPDTSILLASQALEMALRNNFRELEGLSYYILSKANWAKANFRLGAEYGFKALKIFENSKQTGLWGKSLLSLARTFIDLKYYDQGGIYIERALTLAREVKDVHLLAEVYREKSMLLSEQKQYDSAMIYADRGLEMFQDIEDQVSISIIYGRKAKIYFLKHDYKNSTLYNRKSLMLDSLTGNRRALGISYYQAALDAIHMNKMDSAIFMLKKSIAVNQGIGNILTLTKAHELLAGVYMEKKRHDLAAKQLKLVSQYKDSLYHTERAGQIQEMLSLYELSSKQETIEQLAQDNLMQQQQVKNQRWFAGFLLICVVLLAVVIFFLTRLRRLQEKTNVELGLKNSAIEQQKEEIQAQAETLQQLNDLKSKLFSVVSHDLRGPMATLHSLLDLLSRQKLTPDEFITVSDKLRSNMEATRRTLDNLLNWSLSQMAGIRTEARTIDIHRLFKETSALLTQAADQKSIRIIADADASLKVSADADQIQLILRNLLHNAIKFSKLSSSVYVSASRESGFCRISVRDLGMGMTQEEIDVVMESNNHFSKVGTLQEKGTGLGLLLCKEFIKLNGGTLSITSKPNEGTEVTFTIPLADSYQEEAVLVFS